MLKKLFLPFFLIATCMVFAQTSRFGLYYDQRKSLFEKLPDTPGEIIFLGNSITDGAEWTELFNNINVKNRGISADVTAGVLNRLDEVTRSKPSKIFLLIGTNDIARNVPFDTVFSNICRIVENVKRQSPSTIMFIQSILPVNDSYTNYKNHVNKTQDIKQMNKRLQEWCTQNNCIFIDLFSPLVAEGTDKLDPKYTNDGLHLMGDGYLKWIEIIDPYVKNY